MFFRSDKYYLSQDGRLSSNREEALLIEEELVSSIISRFKVGNFYLGCLNSRAFLTTRNEDASLFLLQKNKGQTQTQTQTQTRTYITLAGLPLTLNDGLVASLDCEEISNLTCEYLSELDVLYYKFKRDGWVNWEFDMSKENIEKTRDLILKDEESRIGNLFQLDPVFFKFLKDEKMKQLLSRIYKSSNKDIPAKAGIYESSESSDKDNDKDDNYHLTTFSSNTLRKGDPDMRFFHVDYPYHDLKSPYPENILGIQVIFALDDFKVENGATLYIPYSFHARAFPNNIEVEKIEPMKLCKGSLLFFRGDLWHSQGINTTDNPRVAVLANFSPLEIPAKDNMVQQLEHLEQNKNLEYVKIENGKVLLLDDS